MDKINIEGIDLTDAMLNELKRWYESKNETVPESFVGYINYTKNLLIEHMCNNATEDECKDIREALSQLIILEKSLRKLIPARTCQN